eukprot:m.130310 g.130310  ORF g.130310 m.130310 type:complete len:184 (+) comp13709_c0_seq1:197-748(+)
MRAFVIAALVVSGGVNGVAAQVKPGQWEALREALQSWTDLSFDANYAVTVGDATGNLFTYVSPGFSMTTRVEGASLSKWPSAVMISGLVADGILSYDDLASKYLPYWSTEKNDPRSRVTLRSLLSFTSGLLEDHYGFCVPVCKEAIRGDSAEILDRTPHRIPISQRALAVCWGNGGRRVQQDY